MTVSEASLILFSEDVSAFVPSTSQNSLTLIQSLKVQCKHARSTPQVLLRGTNYSEFIMEAENDPEYFSAV